jgi:uncharacterized protein YjbI with pentapeptide repeats
MALLLTGGAKAVSDNAALIGALVALGGVFTTQMVNSALEDRRTRAAALQAYLDRMGNLLGEKGVRKADERALARAHTLAVLEGLDPKRKGVVVQFLRESNLIPREVSSEQDKVVDLSGANLRDAELFGLNLREAGLDGAFLERADLRKAHLPDANLGGTRLYGANLTGANLSGASLWNAQLQSRPDLHMEAANLSGANLSGANLSGANLSGANLSGAGLSGAYKLKNDLSPELVTNEELKEQAASLEGATMPDGQKYEDWLESEGRGEAGENPDPS